MPSAATWIGLEIIILSEVSQKEKNKYRMLTHIYGIKKKKGSEEPSSKTAINMQTQSMDFRTWGMGRVSWEEVREWRGHI